MSVSSGTKKCNLPPNVRGKQRGILKLMVLDIAPKSPTTSISSGTTTSSYNSRSRNPISTIGSGGVSVRLIWWGQSHENSAVLNYSPVQKPHKTPVENHCVEYSIQTTPNLFQNYLANCEPVEIKLTSNTSNLQIGTAFLKIPKALVENCTKVDAEHIEAVKIFSPRNTALGEIRIKFKMLFYPRPENTHHEDSIVEVKRSVAAGKENELHIPCLESSRSCKSIKSDINTYISQIRQKASRPVTAASTSSLSFRAIDYLSGREMSEEDKNKALEEIHSTSPLESLMTELTNRLNTPARDVLERIDSMRLALLTITILPAGIRELECSQLDERTFTVESHISPNLLGHARAKYDHDVIRFYSEYVDGKERRIDFNRDAIRSIKISEYVDNSYIRFTIWSRPFGSKYSRCFGTAKLQFASMLQAGELEQTKKLTIKSCTDKTLVGYLITKVTLGAKGVHFGEDFLTIIEHTEQHKSPPTTTRSRSSEIHRRNQTPVFERLETPCRKCINNDTRSKPNSPKSSNCNTTSRSSCYRKTASTYTEIGGDNNRVSSTESIKEKDNKQIIEIDKSINRSNQYLLQGLIYVGSIRYFRELQNGGYFLVCRAFWKEDATSTEFYQNSSFNFLEIFPVVNNEAFLERTRNNHLDLELWQKFTDTAEQMVGIVKLPLHQFYIAFRDNVLTSHLSQAKLPVISIDGWVTVTSPLSAESCGQLQVLLAIGTEEQLEYLKASRGLCLNRVYDASLSCSLQDRLPVPQNVPGQKPCERSISSCDAESQTNFPDNNQDNDETSVRRERLSDLLGNFIDSLAQKLPPNAAQSTDASVASTNIENPSNSASQVSHLKKTSDLLDELQKALDTPPQNVDSVANSSLFKLPTNTLGANVLRRRFVKILLEVENALHLPRNPKKIGNKKMLKRNNTASKSKQSRLPADEEPSAYATFQAEEGSGPMIKSHEGMVYATNVVEKSCNPVWNRRYEIYVPADLMKNDEKRFIVKVWRKRVTDLAQCRLLPTPLEDAIIGFAAVDLNVLLAGMPCIAGWFNIVDFNGRINGQIKINVRPLEDVLKFKDPAVLPSKKPVLDPVSISSNVIKAVPTVAGVDMNNSMLSRAIKRKFTELEEITERLRARLLDVTGAPECPATLNTEGMLEGDQIDEQLDEFERDLNTACDDDHQGDTRENFGWLGLTGAVSNGSGNDDSDMSLSTNDSQERIKLISDCLRRTDLNFVGENAQLANTKERNPPEGETASSCEKKHVD